MIIADTNIIIRFWRRPDEKTMHIFQTEKVGICGVIKAEILHGAKSEEDCQRILKALAGIPCLSFGEQDWDFVGRNLYLLRSHGITMPFQDVLIASTAICNGASIWSNDKHFAYFQRVIPELQIFVP